MRTARVAVAIAVVWGLFAPTAVAADAPGDEKQLPGAPPSIEPGSVDTPSTESFSPAGQPGSGYWLADISGQVYGFGSAAHHGAPRDHWANYPNCAVPGLGYCDLVIDIEPTPRAGPEATSGDGYWVLDTVGFIWHFGDAPHLGEFQAYTGDPWMSITATAGGDGLWGFSATGCVETLGSAPFHGDLCDVPLNAHVVGSAVTPSGNGYYMVAADGGIFAFGDAAFYGSTGDMRLNQPVTDMVVSPSGRGYWLVALDGGIFAFGDAPFYGSMGDVALNRPISGMVASPTGGGYLMVGEDGGIFSFGDVPFHGSLGGSPPAWPVVSVAAR